MQEFIEKLIGRLEEAMERYEDVSFFEMNTNGHTLDFEYANGKKDGVSEAIEIVKQEAEKYNNGWIPCSERLPEDGETYLVTNAESFGQCHTYKGWYDGKHKIWHMEENFERKMNVVAWQPLPQPYQPKGE